MTENELLDCGFIKEVEDSEDEQFYYYTYDIADDLSFITSANDDIINNNWWVEIWDVQSIRLYDINKVKVLIEILQSSKYE